MNFYYAGLTSFILSQYYTTQVIILLFQKIVLFVVKVILFPFTFGLYMLYTCICRNKCRCKGHRDGAMGQFRGQVQIDVYRNLGLDPVVASGPGGATPVKPNKSGNSPMESSQTPTGTPGARRYTEFQNKRFYRSKDSCIRLKIVAHLVKQWASLMFHDENKYIENQTCEYCNEEFVMFDKVIFPGACVNNKNSPTAAPATAAERPRQQTSASREPVVASRSSGPAVGDDQQS